MNFFHQVGISVPGATLGDRSTSCLGRHLCQSDHDDVNDGDTDEAVDARLKI